MTNEEFDEQVDATKKMLDGLPEELEFQKRLLTITLENLRAIRNAPARDELGLSGVAERLRTLNGTIEAGLKRIEDVKRQKEARK